MTEILKLIKSPSYDIKAGFGIIVLGLVIVIFGSYLDLEKWVELGKYSVAIGLGLLSVGLALDTSEKMKSISNTEFLHVVNMLEDARIEFNKTLSYLDYIIRPEKYKIPPIPGYSPETFTWKTKNCIEMAVELLKRDEKKKYIEPDYQDKLFHYFNMSFKHLFKLPSNIWKNEDKSMNHFITSYAMLDDYYNDKCKEEFNKALEKNLGKAGKKDFLEKAKIAKTKLLANH